MFWIVFFALYALTVAAMEGFAWAAHKYVMHGWGWAWHESHHRPRDGRFEKNDLFAVVFSIPSILMIYIGLRYVPPLLPVGCGIATYGVIYFVFHDIIVHRRIKTPMRQAKGYWGRIIRAHRIHHAVGTKDNCVSFGFLYAPQLDHLRTLLHKRNPNLQLTDTRRETATLDRLAS